MAMEAMARQAIEDRNYAALDWLRALGLRLSDEELTDLVAYLAALKEEK